MQSLGRGRDRARRIDAERLASGKEARPPRVLRTFAIYTAVAFAIASLAILYMVRVNGRDQAEQKLAEFSTFVGNSVIANTVPEDAWNAPLTGATRQQLDNAIEASTLDDTSRTVRLYGPTGELIYQNNDLAESANAGSNELQQALDGTAIGTQSTDSGTDSIHGISPVTYPGQDQPAGVVDVGVEASAVIGPMRTAAVPLIITLLLIMAGLYLALWPLLKRTTNQLSYSYNELRRRADDLNENLIERAAIENRLRDTILELERSEMALAHSQEETIMRLSLAVESRDAETGSHIERMGRYCELLAGKIGWTDDECDLLRIASPLHDVGKIAIPDSVLQKPGRLTPEERVEIEKHAEIGHQILAGSDSPLLDLAARIALTHHEHWDGAGYPNGIAGEEIPVEGRIAAIADVFDALTSDRVYRKAMPVEKALSIMSEGRGAQFDPQLLDVFFDSIVEVLMIRDGRKPKSSTVSQDPEASQLRRRKRKAAAATITMADEDGEQQREMVG